mmetsp:Transcript_22282/g.39230  ORF Transcript_22282/g.39230 Transcript_22282/m.39230 type:complete len:360 (-) Transcript_22282:346-1425(-)
MKYTPPFSVCRSFDGRENDDHTNTNLRVLLTRPCGGNEAIQEECDLAHLFATKQNSQMYRPRSLSLPDQILIDTVPLQEKQRQELIHLKLRIAQQKEKLGILSSKLSQCEVENEALKAEKAVLVDKLAHAHGATQEQPQLITRRRQFSKAGDSGGSMQLLIDTNSKLVMDNARLHGMVVNVQAIETLLKLSLTDGTAKTSLESSFSDENQEALTIDSSQHSFQDSMLTNSFHSIPEQELKFGTSGDDWIIEGEDIEVNDNDLISERAARERRATHKRAARMNIMLKESRLIKETNNTFSEGAARCMSADLLVEFGETESRRPRRTDGRLCHSLTEWNAERKSKILLVDFGETRRARSMA